MLEIPRIPQTPTQKETAKNPENKAEDLRAAIEAILLEFKKDKDIALMFEKIEKIKEQNPAPVFEEAWKQEQIDLFLDILNDDSLYLEITRPEYFKEFQFIFCQGKARETEDEFAGFEANQLNEEVYLSLRERLYESKDKGMSDFLLTLSSRLDYHLFPNDPETDDDFSQDLFGAGYIIDGWEETYKKNPHNLLRSLKILKGAKTFLAQGKNVFYGSYMESGADYVISQIEDSDNYFIRKGVEAYVDRAPLKNAPIEVKKELLQYHVPGYDETEESEILRDFHFYLYDDSALYENARRAENRFQLEKYDESNLRESSSVNPLTTSKDYSAYSTISKDLAVIYDYDSRVDSFFTINKPSRRITLPEVLEREGFDRKNLSPDDYGLLLYNYKSLIEIPLREKIENEFKIKLKDFSIRQQLQFLNFLSTKTTDQVEIVRKFLTESSDNSRNNTVKSFLSLELDGSNGNRIIEIGEKLKSEDADKVFAKISEIVDKIEEGVSDLASGEIKVDPNEVSLGLLERTHKIILDFSGKEKDTEKLLTDLENSQTEIILLSALLKTAKESEEPIDLETIKNLKLERRVIGERDENGEEIKLGEEEKKEMLAMVEKNYREVVFPDNPQAAAGVIADFKKELEKGLLGQMVYTLKFQGKLAAFARFKKLNDEEVYAGSLNVHQEVNNLCLGKYFTNSILPEVARQFRIKAITRADNPAITLYEKQGFAIDKAQPFEKYGETYYNMTMEKTEK